MLVEEKALNCVDENEAKKYYADQYDKLVWVDQEKIQSQKGYILFKRTLDIVGSFAGLIVTSPILLWVSYKIQQEEPGNPVIFKQTRVGREGKEFTMYKFRSMCVDAENKLEELLNKNEVEGAMFKMKEDPRVTKIGKFIRKSSLDELPQLLNVLKGDMSLVGPRPPLEREVKEYTPHDKQRLLVKPGCSGLWQISGRNEVGFDEMVDFDIEYIKNRSMINDLKIIFKTVKLMIKPDGAY